MADLRDEIRIHARIEEIPAACSFVVAAASRAGLTGRALHNCQLAVDEACTNIVEHTYHGGDHDRFIDLICTWDSGLFSIEILDNGPAFDPLQQPSPDPALPLDGREKGGWGVHFIRNMTDGVRYERRDGRNHLWLEMRLPAGAAGREMVESDNRVLVTEITKTLKIVNLSGRLDATASADLEQILAGNLDNGSRYLVLDMRGVDYISSSGWKMLVGVWKRARDAKGDLILSAMQPGVQETLKLIGFDLVFTTFDSPDDATAHYR